VSTVIDAPPFSIRLATQPPRLAVTGALGMATAGELEAALTAQMADHGEVVLDLSELTFMDSSGIRVLVSSIKLAERNGWRFSIRDELPDHVRRLLDVTGIGPFLPLVA
jgi:anti-sigma B factor antagonist